MRLLERTAALAALHECPPGRVVLVSGEAGIGKSSLVRRFRDESARTVLWGECDAMRTPRPLGPVRDRPDHDAAAARPAVTRRGGGTRQDRGASGNADRRTGRGTAARADRG
ncbi:hypothetical protein EAS64_36870 [Trebonia kvetii]|uniref:Orc1-like AAA ATPase domain-containing protein n=1 Tax=Trebonia kvetii TaxID=2480626 RepID=A0A6P2BSJ1_9ACTN|nr:AAA family ATPase [Trebonia kvetii]TVZ00233.1 hypothetical protein EAS64_36870 [Trebonia kvetii]